MVYLDRSWWPKGLNRWGLDPRKAMAPQVAANVFGVAFILLGPGLAMVTLKYWPPLVTDEAIYVGGLGGIALFFLLSWAVIPNRVLPPKLPLAYNIMFRLGLGLAATGWVIGVGGIANGAGMPTSSREVPVVAKHHTRERDRTRRINYLSARPWASSRRVQDVEAPLAVFEALQAPQTAIDTPRAELEAMPDVAKVRLVVGQGRLGLAWLKTVEPAG